MYGCLVSQLRRASKDAGLTGERYKINKLLTHMNCPMIGDVGMQCLPQRLSKKAGVASNKFSELLCMVHSALACSESLSWNTPWGKLRLATIWSWTFLSLLTLWLSTTPDNSFGTKDYFGKTPTNLTRLCCWRPCI